MITADQYNDFLSGRAAIQRTWGAVLSVPCGVTCPLCGAEVFTDGPGGSEDTRPVRCPACAWTGAVLSG